MEVARFADAMLHELDENSHKGTWSDYDQERLFFELDHHVMKLKMAMEREASLGLIIHYAADVGNCAMFCADNLGALGPDWIEQRQLKGQDY